MEGAFHEPHHLLVIREADPVEKWKGLRDGRPVDSHRIAAEAQVDDQMGQVIEAVIHSNGIERNSFGHEKFLKFDPGPFVSIEGTGSPTGGDKLEGDVLRILEPMEMSESRQTTR